MNRFIENIDMVPATLVRDPLTNNMPIHDLRFPLEINFTSASSPLDKKYNRVIKRIVDFSVSLTMIILLLSWLIPILAILIKLSSRGPVFFLQKRNRHGGKTFQCLKFRTMIVNDEADLLAARANDDRVTAFGKFLRHYHLDELPQLVNVLLGDMSLIGPRPHMLSDNRRYEKLIRGYDLRHKVKPGITGLAQMKGYCGPIDNFQTLEARVNMDIFYIRNWSPKLDIMILYRTIHKTIGK